MKAFFRFFAVTFPQQTQATSTQPPEKKGAIKVDDLLKLSEQEILDNLFTLDKPQRLYTHEYARPYIDPCPNEYGDSNGDPEYFLFKVRDKIVSTITGGLELEGTSSVSRSDFEKAIELTTLLSNRAKHVGLSTMAIDQFTVGFDSRRNEIYSKVEGLDQISDDRGLVSKLKEMVSAMGEASALVVA